MNFSIIYLSAFPLYFTPKSDLIHCSFILNNVKYYQSSIKADLIQTSGQAAVTAQFIKENSFN